ncbi:primase-helicase family protein [Sulfitobacter sp.]|uniref:primase-helicase family protein n=1 Tax=Sulfitobacter sp. TaxID=1903071 RepID=UPI0030022E0C
MTKASNNEQILPAGFVDISHHVVATMSRRYSTIEVTDEEGNTTKEDMAFNQAQKKAVSYILDHVVKYQGYFLTCFADNKPILGNDLETTVDVCAVNTNALDRKMIRHVLTSAPISFQRHQYCPGFPRFLKVDGATTYNTWRKNDRLTLTEQDIASWANSKPEAQADLDANVADGVPFEEVAEGFALHTEPLIWRVMLRMLFGDGNSPVASEDWMAEHDVFTRWFACCVHRPLDRIRWAPIIRGSHGIGKGTFQHMAKALMGSGSVSVVNDLEGITGQFAGEKALTRLLVVDECWSKSGKAMERFKPIVSEDHVNVERKGEQSFSTRATHNTIVFSNHHTPFKSSETERRWWVPCYRNYDQGEDATKQTNQAFHAEGNRLIREAMPLSAAGDQDQIRDLLCWLKVVADMVPAAWLGTAPASEGFMDLVDTDTENAHDHLKSWLGGLQTKDALSLNQVVSASSVPQSMLKDMMTKDFNFRSCQMKCDRGRKVWTKAPVGVGPTNLVEYKSP